MKKEKIRVLIIKPMERPKVYYIEPTMRAFRYVINAKAVRHRDIQAKRLERDVYAIFGKDEADLPPNRQIEKNIISGTMLIVATDDRKLPVSLADDTVSKYSLRFWNIETFDEINVPKGHTKPFLSRLRKAE